MPPFTPIAQSAIRLGLAGIFGHAAGHTLVLPLLEAQAAYGIAPRLRIHPGEIAIHALLGTMAVWLAFGVRTRVIALAATVLLLGWDLLAPPDLLGAGPRVEVLTLVACALAAPLMVFGGGPRALYRRGWRDLL